MNAKGSGSSVSSTRSTKPRSQTRTPSLPSSAVATATRSPAFTRRNSLVSTRSVAGFQRTWLSIRGRSGIRHRPFTFTYIGWFVVESNPSGSVVSFGARSKRQSGALARLGSAKSGGRYMASARSDARACRVEHERAEVSGRDRALREERLVEAALVERVALDLPHLLAELEDRPLAEGIRDRLRRPLRVSVDRLLRRLYVRAFGRARVDRGIGRDVPFHEVDVPREVADGVVERQVAAVDAGVDDDARVAEELVLELEEALLGRVEALGKARARLADELLAVEGPALRRHRVLPHRGRGLDAARSQPAHRRDRRALRLQDLVVPVVSREALVRRERRDGGACVLAQLRRVVAGRRHVELSDARLLEGGRGVVRGVDRVAKRRR